MTFFNDEFIKRSDSDFEKIALPHMSYIFKVAYRLAGNRALAEDLTQETFIVAMQKFEQLKDPAKVKSWLFVIMRNLFLGGVEKNKNKYFMDFDDVSYVMADESLEAERVWRDGFSDDVQHHLDRLDDKYRRPLEMSVLADYSYKEIARKLSIPIGTVMSRIARGKSFLRREITKSGNYENGTMLA